MSPHPERRIFISHASVDKPLVRKLAAAIEEEGLSPWVDEFELLPGDDLPGEISAALNNAAAVIVVISKAAVASKWLAYELRIATLRMIQNEVVVIPVRVDETEPPAEIKSLIWADFTGSFEDGWRVVRAALSRAFGGRLDDGGRIELKESIANDGLLGLDKPQGEELRRLLGEKVADVLRATRVLEARTGFASGVAKSRLLDCFAHVCYLVERSEFSSAEQSRQIEMADEHLRSALREGGEEVVMMRIADVMQRWDEYQRIAFPLRKRMILDGVPSHAELRRLLDEIRRGMELVRAGKLSADWNDAMSAAAKLHELAIQCEVLSGKLEECIKNAEVARSSGSTSVRDRIFGAKRRRLGRSSGAGHPRAAPGD